MRILVVDDSGFARKALMRIVQGLLADAEVFEAETGEIAVQLYAQEAPDLTFLDLTLPGMRGQEVLAEIKQMNEDAKVIVVSADIQMKTRELIESIGAVTMVNKPVTADKIAQALKLV